MLRNSRLSLHIPEPHARPGGRPDFGYLDLRPAGETRRPEPDAQAGEMRDMPYALVRVLDDAGRALGPWAPQIQPQTLRKGLAAMIVTRAFDDRIFKLHRQGKTSFFMRSTGEEALGVAPSLALAKGDMCFPTYRMVGFLMARDYPLLDLVNQIFSNAADPLKGRQMPVLYSARDYGFYSVSGNLGSRYGHAVGWAMASAWSGDDKIALAYVGEGTTAEGNVHEALTFASVYHAPVILAITNNQWAISSFQGTAGGEETTFAARALAYGLPGLRVDGNDFLAVHSAIAWAADRARSNLGATLIEFVTYRSTGHSTSDDPTRYRPDDEALAFPLGDPIERLKTYMIAEGMWSEAEHQALVQDCDERVRAAVKAGEAIGTLGVTKPPVGTMFEDVFKTPDWRQIRQRREVEG